MKGESVIIILLVAGIAVGLVILVLTCLHYRHLRRLMGSLAASRQNPAGELPRTEQILLSTIRPLSPTEKKNFYLFMDGKSTEEIAVAMHVEPSSVYTVKYRIKKKFPEDFSLPF